jgi:hypothetical protein
VSARAYSPNPLELTLCLGKLNNRALTNSLHEQIISLRSLYFRSFKKGTVPVIKEQLIPSTANFRVLSREAENLGRTKKQPHQHSSAHNFGTRQRAKPQRSHCIPNNPSTSFCLFCLPLLLSEYLSE